MLRCRVEVIKLQNYKITSLVRYRWRPDASGIALNKSGQRAVKCIHIYIDTPDDGHVVTDTYVGYHWVTIYFSSAVVGRLVISITIMHGEQKVKSAIVYPILMARTEQARSQECALPLGMYSLVICKILETNMLFIPLENVRHPTQSACCLCWTAVVENNSFSKLYARCFVQCNRAHYIIEVLILWSWQRRFLLLYIHNTLDMYSICVCIIEHYIRI
jgi:hypothetical protein